MESYQCLRQAGLMGFDGCFPGTEADGNGRFTPGDCHGYDELLLFHQTANKSDFAVDTRFFKNRFKRLDERSARQRL